MSILATDLVDQQHTRSERGTKEIPILFERSAHGLGREAALPVWLEELIDVHLDSRMAVGPHCLLELEVGLGADPVRQRNRDGPQQHLHHRTAVVTEATMA